MHSMSSPKFISERSGHVGYTMVEVLITMTIFFLGVLAVSSLQIKNGNTRAIVRMQTEELTWASDRIEMLMALDYEHADLTSGNHGPVSEGSYSIVWNVQDDTPLADTKTISVTVSGSNPNARPLTIDFIRGR